jgi:hypothetical protein
MLVVIAVAALGMGATLWALRMRRLATYYAVIARMNKQEETFYRGWETTWRRSAQRIDERARFQRVPPAFGSSDDLTGELIDRKIWRLSTEAREAAARCGTKAAHHAALNRKYERAARYPWLTVQPDALTP